MLDGTPMKTILLLSCLRLLEHGCFIIYSVWYVEKVCKYSSFCNSLFAFLMQIICRVKF